MSIKAQNVSDWFRRLNKSTRKSIVADFFLIKTLPEVQSMEWYLDFLEVIDNEYHHIKAEEENT